MECLTNWAGIMRKLLNRAGIMACPKFDQEIFLRHQCIVYNTRNTFNGKSWI